MCGLMNNVQPSRIMMTYLDKVPRPSACLDTMLQPCACLDMVPRPSAMPSHGALV